MWTKCMSSMILLSSRKDNSMSSMIIYINDDTVELCKMCSVYLKCSMNISMKCRKDKLYDRDKKWILCSECVSNWTKLMSSMILLSSRKNNSMPSLKLLSSMIE